MDFYAVAVGCCFDFGLAVSMRVGDARFVRAAGWKARLPGGKAGWKARLPGGKAG